MLSVSVARGAFVFLSVQYMTAELKVIALCNCDHLHNEHVYIYIYALTVYYNNAVIIFLFFLPFQWLSVATNGQCHTVED